MELEIVKFFLNLNDTFIFDAFQIITGKIYILISVSIFIAYAVYRLKIKAINFILAAIISVSVSDLICYRVLKPAIGRLRPSVELRYMNKDSMQKKSIPEKPGYRDFSMPSNHASNIFAFFIVYFIFIRKYWIPALINSLLIAISRVVVGKHYPTDVLAGIITGTFIGLSVVYLFYLISHIRKSNIKETI